MGWLDRHHLNASNWTLAMLIFAALLLFLAGVAGMSYVAGFHAVWARVQHPQAVWLVSAAVSEVIAFLGYGVAYRGLTRVERGPVLRGRTLLAVIASGFGGFIAQGGGALDRYAMKAGGASDRDASARVSALGGLEHGAMPFIVCPVAIYLVATGARMPPGDFTWPWAILPPVGFAIGIFLAERYRDRLRHRSGWRGKLGVFMDGIHYVWCLIRHPIRNDVAIVGMLIFWGATIVSIYAGMAAFGYEMSAGPLIIAFGTGYVATQRTAPLGGCGLLMVVLPPCLMYAGAPLSVAILGVLVHRVFSLWLFMPLAIAGIPRLRALGHRRPADTRGEPALQH